VEIRALLRTEIVKIMPKRNGSKVFEMNLQRRRVSMLDPNSPRRSKLLLMLSAGRRGTFELMFKRFTTSSSEAWISSKLL
jgi:hypothetical protein